MANKHQQTCPIASFLNVFGDSWTLLIIREAFYGATRFSEFRRNTGIAKNLLSERLNMLLEEGILEQEDVGARGPRYAYKLTEKGQSLVPVFVSMIQWSNQHIYGPGNEPVHLVERATGRRLKKFRPTSSSDKSLEWADILAKPGPGSSRAARERILESEYGTES